MRSSWRNRIAKASAGALLAPAALAVFVICSASRARAQEVEQTYARKCAVCHGKDGSGQTTMGKKNNVKDFKTSDLEKKSDDELFNVIAKGTKGMTGFSKSLGDEQCHALVAYVRQLAKK